MGHLNRSYEALMVGSSKVSGLADEFFRRQSYTIIT